MFATNGEEVSLLEKINQAEDAAKLFHTNPHYQLPLNEIDKLKKILEI